MVHHQGSRFSVEIGIQTPTGGLKPQKVQHIFHFPPVEVENVQVQQIQHNFQLSQKKTFYYSAQGTLRGL